MVVKTIPFEIFSHKRLVCSLYKRALRNIESFIIDTSMYRYEAVLLRARFDANKAVADPIKAKQLLQKGEQELFDNKHYSPIVFFDSPQGIAYEREVEPPDCVLDFWHPLEKAQYPDYFARREQRKKEYIQWYEKKYGKPTPEELGHH